MRSKLKLVRNIALVCGIVGALAFGATQTSGCLVCNPPDDESCDEYPNPDLYCDNWCQNVQGCQYGGACGRLDYCECLIK